MLPGVHITLGDTERLTSVHLAAYSGNKVGLEHLLDSIPLNVQAAAVNAVDSEGRTPLHLACANGHQNVAQVLLMVNGIQIDKRDSNGRTPLDMSAFKGQTDVLGLLLERDADPNNKDILTGRTPLIAAAMNGHSACVDLLSDIDFDAKPDIVDSFGRNALMYACAKGVEDSVLFLLRGDGMNINAIDSSGLTALHFAAAFGHLDIVSLLLKQDGVNLKIRDKHGFTSAHYAAVGGNDQILRSLVSHRPSLASVVDLTGHTALHYACYFGHDGCVAVLLEDDTPWSSPLEHPFGALHCAVSQGHLSCAETLFEEIDDLDIHAADYHKDMPLHVAARNGRGDCVRLLVSSEADVNALNEDGQTPGMIAALHGHSDALDAILSSESCPLLSAANPDGNTLFHLACFPEGNETAASVAMDHIDENVASMKNNEGETVLHLSAARHYPSVVAKLLALGCDKEDEDNLGLTPILRILRDEKARETLKLLLKAN